MRVSFSQGIEFEPDQGWDYSNINFVLVGLAIERATGQPFAELLEQRILRPLGLADTSYPTTPDMPPGSSQGVCDDGVDITRFNPLAAREAGGMVSNLRDLRAGWRRWWTGSW